MKRESTTQRLTLQKKKSPFPRVVSALPRTPGEEQHRPTTPADPGAVVVRRGGSDVAGGFARGLGCVLTENASRRGGAWRESPPLHQNQSRPVPRR
jgi:hypothetical protein